MKKKNRSYKKIGDFGVKTKRFSLLQKKAFYTADSEKKLIEYMKEKGIL